MLFVGHVLDKDLEFEFELESGHKLRDCCLKRTDDEQLSFTLVQTHERDEHFFFKTTEEEEIWFHAIQEAINNIKFKTSTLRLREDPKRTSAEDQRSGKLSRALGKLGHRRVRSAVVGHDLVAAIHSTSPPKSPSRSPRKSSGGSPRPSLKTSSLRIPKSKSHMRSASQGASRVSDTDIEVPPLRMSTRKKSDGVFVFIDSVEREKPGRDMSALNWDDLN